VKRCCHLVAPLYQGAGQNLSEPFDCQDFFSFNVVGRFNTKRGKNLEPARLDFRKVVIRQELLLQKEVTGQLFSIVF